MGPPSASLAASTLRAYRSDWADFSNWCAMMRLKTLPAGDGGRSAGRRSDAFNSMEAQAMVAERAHMSVVTSKANGGLTRVLARPVRVQLRRTAGWRKPEGCIVVARPTRWGNPYAVGAGEVSWSGTVAGTGVGFYGDGRYHGDLGLGRGLRAAEAVFLYRRELTESLADDDPFFDELRRALAGLQGHDLACWCPLVDAEGRAVPCHADVLLELANAPREAR